MADTQRVRIPVPGGLVTATPSDHLEPINSPDMSNIRAKYGIVHPAPGRAQVLAAPVAEELRGIFRSPQASGDEWILGLFESKFYRFGTVAPGTLRQWEEILAGGTAISSNQRKWSAITAEDKFFFTNGGTIFVWPDGLDPLTGTYVTIDSLVTSGVAPQGRFLEYYNDRLIVGYTIEGGASTSYRIRWSENGDFRRWDDTLGLGAGFMDLYEDSQESITGLRNLGDRLVVYKEHAIIDIVKTGILEPTFAQEVRVRGIGTRFSHTIASNGLVHFFLGSDLKVYAWNGVQAVVISTEIEDRLYSIIDTSLVDDYFGFVSTLRGEYWLVVGAEDVFVYDYIQQRWFADKYPLRTITSIAEVEDSEEVYTWLTIPGTWEEQTDTWESLRAAQRTTTWMGHSTGVLAEVGDQILGDAFGPSSLLQCHVDSPDFYILDPQEMTKIHRVIVLYDFTIDELYNFLISHDRGLTWTAYPITPISLGISMVDTNVTGNITRFRLSCSSTNPRFKWKSFQYEWQPEGPFIPST